jgi:hypothetical protein
MPTNLSLVDYGLRQTSRQLALDRARRYHANYLRTGNEEYAKVAEAEYAKSGSQVTVSGTGSAGGGTGGAGRPERPELPEFEAPEYDDRAVAAKTQKIAAPRIRQLREAVRTTQAQSYENPNIKRMTVGQALQGYGTGLESVMAGARRGAISEYGQEYQSEFSEAQMNFQAQLAATMQEYGNLWNEYLLNVKSNLSNRNVGGGDLGLGLRSDPNYRPPSGLGPDPNDPGTIGSRPIITEPGQGTTGPIYGTPQPL